MSWACILLPQLALDGVLRRHPQPERPLALVTGPAQKRVLAAVNPAAARLGLHAGQALAAAHALLSGFATLEYDPDEVARSRDFLAAWAYRYSSQVGTAWRGRDRAGDRRQPAPVRPVAAFRAAAARGSRCARLHASHRGGAESARRLGAGRHARRPGTDAAVDIAHRPRPHPGRARAAGREDRTGVARDGIAPARAVVRRATRIAGATLRQRPARTPRPPARRRAGSVPAVSPAGPLRPAAGTSLRDRTLAGAAVPGAPHDRRPGRLPRRSRRRRAALRAAPGTRGPSRHRSRRRHARRRTRTVAAVRPRPRAPGAGAHSRAGARPAPGRATNCRRSCRPDANCSTNASSQAMPWTHAARTPARAAGRRRRLRPRTRGRPSPGTGLAPHAAAGRDEAGNRTGTASDLAAATPDSAARSTLRILAGPERVESGWWDGGDVRRDYYVVETSSGQRAWAYRGVGETDTPFMLHGWFAVSCCTDWFARASSRTTPSCIASPTSASAAAHRVRANCSIARNDRATARWRSPTNARSPASCADWKPRARPACG